MHECMVTKGFTCQQRELVTNGPPFKHQPLFLSHLGGVNA